jgi:tyrosine-specific transport protein
MRENAKAIAVLVGTTIGAGIFGIPFVISKVGFAIGVVYLSVLGILILFLNLIYGEVILRTPGDHQMNGYLRIYFQDRKGKFLNFLSTTGSFLSFYGALLAYLIKIGEFLVLLFGGGSPTLFSFLFFIFGCLALYFGIRAVSSFEFLLVIFLLILIAFISILGSTKIEAVNLLSFNPSYLLLPYGVILFAFGGSSVIPEMEELLRQKPGQLKKAIIIGSLIPLLTYLMFSFFVVGVSGSLTSDDAISGLTLFLPSYIVKIGALLGVLTMGSSFLTLSYVLRETWLRDFKFPKGFSFTMAVLPSFVLFILGARNFINILDFSGAVSGGLFGILILALYEKAKKLGKRKPAFVLKLPRFLIYFLYLIFIVGMFFPFLARFGIHV